MIDRMYTKFFHSNIHVHKRKDLYTMAQNGHFRRKTSIFDGFPNFRKLENLHFSRFWNSYMQ